MLRACGLERGIKAAWLPVAAALATWLLLQPIASAQLLAAGIYGAFPTCMMYSFACSRETRDASLPVVAARASKHLLHG